jgi:hypothetical protein
MNETNSMKKTIIALLTALMLAMSPMVGLIGMAMDLQIPKNKIKAQT